MSTSQRRFESPTQMSWMTTSTECARILKTRYECRNTTWALGLSMRSGRQALVNLSELDQFSKEPFQSTLSTSLCGSSTLKWKCEINSSTQPETCGNALASICLESISSGTNMPWWKKCSVRWRTQGEYLRTGWHGSRLSMRGTLSLSLSSDVAKSRSVETSLKGLSIPIHYPPVS